MFCVPGPLDMYIFSYQTIKNQYSYSSLHGAPWRSLAHSGVLWCLPVLPSASWRSLSLSGAPQGVPGTSPPGRGRSLALPRGSPGKSPPGTHPRVA